MKRALVFIVSLVIVVIAGYIALQSITLPNQCLQDDQRLDKEIYGPTDVNAAFGNQYLSTAINEEGTITVFKYPYPSYWDQIKYHTSNRSEPYMGAEPNEGAFLGLIIEVNGEQHITWFRGDEWVSEQRYIDNLSTDALTTQYESAEHGLIVEVNDIVAPDRDVYIRDVEVQRLNDSDVDSAELVSYSNFNLVTSKRRHAPIQDWCVEHQNDDEAFYDMATKGVIHWKGYNGDRDAGVNSGLDIAIGVGFDGDVNQVQVGGDRVFGADNDAYDEVNNLELSGDTEYTGQTTAALTQELDLSNGSDSTSVYFGATSADREEAPDELQDILGYARGTSFEEIRAEKEEWFNDKIRNPPMPENPENPNVTMVSKRALIDLVLASSPGLHEDHTPTHRWEETTASTVASITTQPPYGLDWSRDSAWFNFVKNRGLNQPGWVRENNEWYTDLQYPDKPHYLGLLMPDGSWAMNYYHDGVVGAPIPWEIDATAYAVWSMQDHHAQTGNETYLRNVYPAIKKATDNVLVDCRDASNGLQCRTHEDDHIVHSQTTVGAASVYAGLEAGIKAARELDRGDDMRRWMERRDELGVAIDEHLWNESRGSYGGGSARLVLPACYKPLDAPRMMSNYERQWETANRSFNDEKVKGQYETKHLNGLAEAWRDDPERMEMVRRGIDWVVDEHATDTYIMGEAWIRKWEDGEPLIEQDVASTNAQPHVWSQSLLYVSAVKAYPPEDHDVDDFYPCISKWNRENAEIGDVTLDVNEGRGEVTINADVINTGTMDNSYTVVFETGQDGDMDDENKQVVEIDADESTTATHTLEIGDTESTSDITGNVTVYREYVNTDYLNTVFDRKSIQTAAD